MDGFEEDWNWFPSDFLFTKSNTKHVFVWWQTVQQSSSYSEVNHSAKWSAVSAVLSANTSRRRSQRPRLKSQNEIAGSD